MARRESKYSKFFRAGLCTITLGFLFAGCATSGHVHSRYLAEGNLAAKNGKYVDASSHYEKALAELPDSLPARRNLGLVKVKLGDYENAIRLLKDVYRAYREDVEVEYFLGEAYRGLRKYSLASEHYQKGLRLEPADMRLVKALAWSWLKMGHTKWCVNLVEPFLKTRPEDHQIRLILANAYNQSGKSREAIALLKFLESDSFKIQSKDKTTAVAEHMLLRSALADAYAETSDCRRALKHYNHVLKFRPFFDGALTGAARCLAKDGKDNAALRYLERAVRANPQSAEAHFILAQVLEDRSKERSTVYYRRFLALTEDTGASLSKEREIAKRSLARAQRGQ